MIFSEYQIKLIEEDSFDFTKEEFIDIYYEDNQWPESEYNQKNIWRNETKNDLLVALMSETLSDDPKKFYLRGIKIKLEEYNNKKKTIFSYSHKHFN